jgi:hypothetical protein
VGELPPALWASDGGQAAMAGLLGVGSLDSLPFNMSLLSSSRLLLRGLYLNRSSTTNGRDGLQSFLDVFVVWSRGPDHVAGGGGGKSVPIAAVVVPVVVVSLGLLVGLLVVLRQRKRRAAAASGASPTPGSKRLLPKVHADASRHSSVSDATDGSQGSGKIEAGLCGSEGQLDRTISGLSGSNISRAMSGPGQDIIKATRSLVLQKTAGDADELVLMSVLGEGSYGKVRGSPGPPCLAWGGLQGVAHMNDERQQPSQQAEPSVLVSVLYSKSAVRNLPRASFSPCRMWHDVRVPSHATAGSCASHQCRGAGDGSCKGGS